MDVINKILTIITNASSNPIMFGIIVVVLIGLSVWGGIWLNKLRVMKAEAEKQKDKDKDIDDLEHKHDDAHGKLEDRLNGKKNP